MATDDIKTGKNQTGYSDSRKYFDFDGERYGYYSVRVFDDQDSGLSSRLPFSIKLMLENSLCHYDQHHITDQHLDLFKNWDGRGGSSEISFMPSRVILQDFTGVPVVADLAALRDSWQELGHDPRKINPVIPVDLVIDHSVMVDCFGDDQALSCNTRLEYERNQERYKFLKWAQASFNKFRAFPPSAGIVHQVNLEHLAEVVSVITTGEHKWVIPDTLVGTDSHTTMINGIGVAGWGVGGIEAEAAMLGQPLSMLLPEVVGMKLSGRLSEGVTATDLALTVTSILRKVGVVGRFVEFFGDGIHNISVEDRATVANMSPEYGATMGYFPVDSQTLAYLRATGRSEKQVKLVEAYCRLQGMLLDSKSPEPIYTQVIELDLSSVRPSLAGPKKPQDLILLTEMKQKADQALLSPVDEGGFGLAGNQLNREVTITHADGIDEKLRDGSVVIAAITSCTNTSNPAVMIGAGLMAQKAVSKGLTVSRFVKTSLAPGSRVVTAYLEKAGLMQDLEKLGFFIAGYGCTTCIGNSGPLVPQVAKAIDQYQLNAAAILSGNRNFEGRVHPQVKMNYLASPLLVIAYALAGNVRLDLDTEPVGFDQNSNPVYLADIWPSDKEITKVIKEAVLTDYFHSEYREALSSNHQWNQLQSSANDLYQWENGSTYIRRPPFVEKLSLTRPDPESIQDARVLAWLGDSITTDHISPAGSIAADSPAGLYLQSQGIKPENFNSYGSRRGNHEVMIRGTFANIRIRNRLVPDLEGGYTRLLPENEAMTIFDASTRYQSKRIPLIILAGREYGSGSSRDWAAKGTALLGVKAVIAESFERIHRSNLIGMGVLPLQFIEGQSAASLGLTGTESYSIPDLHSQLRPSARLQVEVKSDSGDCRIIEVVARIDSEVEQETWLHGGILPQVLRQFAQQ